MLMVLSGVIGHWGIDHLPSSVLFWGGVRIIVATAKVNKGLNVSSLKSSIVSFKKKWYKCIYLFKVLTDYKISKSERQYQLLKSFLD